MEKGLLQSMLKPAFLLGCFAFFGVLLLAIVNQQTKSQIATNERIALLNSLSEVVDKKHYDNDLIADQITLSGDVFKSSAPVTVYRARNKNSPVAAIFVITTPRGYKGSIKLVVGVRKDLTLGGVRVVSHNETPGLGDKMEIAKGNWVLSFNDTSLKAPELSHWGVKKDGGYFDQFTGATITPRAIVQAVRDVLLWCGEEDYFETLFYKNLEKQAPL